MEKIKLTQKKFFDLLPQTKKFGPKLTKDGSIRLGYKNKHYAMCPLTAVRKLITGKAGDLNVADSYFDDSTNLNIQDIMVATDIDPVFDDYGDLTNRTRALRKKLLKSLGLSK